MQRPCVPETHSIRRGSNLPPREGDCHRNRVGRNPGKPVGITVFTRHTVQINNHAIPKKNQPAVFESTWLPAQLREQFRHVHYSLRTEEAKVEWAKNRIRFPGLKHLPRTATKRRHSSPNRLICR